MKKKSIPSGIEDPHTVHYRSFLEEFDIQYTESDYHLHASMPSVNSGWVLYISINPFDLVANKSKIFPLLISISTPFKIIKTYRLHEQLNFGHLGYKNIGKVISIMFENDTQIANHIDKIHAITKSWWGPRVSESHRLSPLLYSSYEIFNIAGKTSTYTTGEKPSTHNTIESPPDTNRESILASKYTIQDTIRSEPGCSFYRAINKSEKETGKYYIIKCVYKGSIMDSFGRDATDRIRWQYESLEQLNIKSLLPLVEFEEMHNKSLLSINCSSGILLSQFIQSALNGDPWSVVDNKRKLKIIQCWQNIVQLVSSFHQKEIVITTLSIFDIYINTNNDALLINWECLYTPKTNLPNPTFREGKRGFLSPDLVGGSLPDFSDDIFSLGAILLSSCTEIPIYRLYEKNRENFRKKLNLLIELNSLEKIIFKCLSENRLERPSLKEIIDTLTEVKNQITSDRENRVSRASANIEEINETINQSILGLSNEIVLKGNLWHSEAEKKSDYMIQDENRKKINHGLYDGVEGVLYFICKAITAGRDLTPLSNIIKRAIEYIDNVSGYDLNKIGQSLYYGSSGLALVIKEIISIGIIQNESNYITTIKHCYSGEIRGENILHGAAGEGLGLIQCESFFSKTDYEKLLNLRINHLLNKQKTDGSWGLPSENKGTKFYSFGYGIAGIVYFLLEAADRHRLNNCIIASEHAIDYLIKNLPIFSTKTSPQSDPFVKKNNFTWCNGIAGIALPFLKAYKLSGSKAYLIAAENALRSIPPRVLSKNLGQCHGLAGLGEVYLEMYKTTQSDEWWERATLIADTICGLKFINRENNVYWLSENSIFPIAGFMTGNSGITHFLMRYLKPNEINLPVL